MNLTRWLAWEVIFLHALTGALFALALGILLANMELDVWWLIPLFAPLVAFGWAGWTYEGLVILRAAAAMRRGEEGKNEGTRNLH